MKRSAPEDRLAIVRLILEAPIDASHKDLAVQVNLDRETVRRIRYGLLDAHLLPDLPRLEANILRRRCTHCVHVIPDEERRLPDGGYKAPCGLGFEESRVITYARGCGAFWPTNTEHPNTP